MGVQYSIWDELDYFYEKEYIEKQDCIMVSDLSILRIWLSLLGEDIIVKPRANNIFYSECCFHNTDDIPVCIDDNKKGFYCYGCGSGGTIITLIANYFNIEREDVVNILYAYINNNLNSLDKDGLEIIKKIFENYDSVLVDKYLEESRQKTSCLNDRISRYIDKFGDSQEIINKMTKRLCCSRDYIIRYNKIK